MENFLGVLDLDLAKGRVGAARYRLLPVFSELLKPDVAMSADRKTARATGRRLMRKKSQLPTACSIAAAISTAPWDQLICDALRTSTTPRSRCRRVFAGAPAYCPDNR